MKVEEFIFFLMVDIGDESEDIYKYNGYVYEKKELRDTLLLFYIHRFLY